MKEIGEFLAEYILGLIKNEGIENLELSFAKFFWIISEYYDSDFLIIC